MLGYVRAYKPEMKFKDFDLYKGVYCSLCKEIGRRYGLIARSLLSYDFTFFAMVRMAVRDSEICMGRSRCSFNPAKRCFDCGNGNEDIEYAADVSMLTAYYKLRDNIEDGGFFERLACKALLPYFRRLYRKAVSRIPDEAQRVEVILKLQSEREERAAGLDEAADGSAAMLSLLLSTRIDCKDTEALRALGYYVGRWVYIVDAVDDCEKDIKKGAFNPLKERHSSEGFNDYCRQTLNMTAAEALKAFDKLKVNRFYDILENILLYGTDAVMRMVLNGRKQNEKSI